MNRFVTELEFKAFGITNGGIEELELAHALATTFGNRYSHSASRQLEKEHEVVGAGIIPAISPHKLTNESVAVKSGGRLLLIKLSYTQLVAANAD